MKDDIRTAHTLPRVSADAAAAQRRPAWRALGIFALAMAALHMLLGVTAAHAQGWYDAGWTHRKAITIDRTRVSGGPHADLPVLVNLASDAQLSARAQASGNDILFTAADGMTKLDPRSSATRVRAGRSWRG